MKKTLLSLAAISAMGLTTLSAIDIDKTKVALEKNLKENFIKNMDFKVIKIEEINKNTAIAIISANGRDLPVFTNEDGSFFMAEYFGLGVKADQDKALAFMKDFVNEQKAKQQGKLLNDVKDVNAAVTLKGNPKARSSLYIFTDPNCPYCRDEMGKIDEQLKEYKEVNLLFVGVIKADSALKSADLISALAKKKDTKAALKMIREVYSDGYTPKSKEMSKEVAKFNQVMVNNRIQGVPYKFESF